MVYLRKDIKIIIQDERGSSNSKHNKIKQNKLIMDDTNTKKYSAIKTKLSNELKDLPKLILKAFISIVKSLLYGLVVLGHILIKFGKQQKIKQNQKDKESKGGSELKW